MPKKRVKTMSLIGVIDEEALKEFDEAFHEADSSPATIELHLHSSGGTVEAGMAIYELIRTSRNPVVTVGLADVCSMAVLVLAAGDHRIVTEGTRILLHDGSVQVHDSLLKAQKHLEEHLRGHRWYAEQLAVRSKSDVSIWMKRLESELYIGPQQALEWGLVDEIRRYRPIKKVPARSFK